MVMGSQSISSCYTLIPRRSCAAERRVGRGHTSDHQDSQAQRRLQARCGVRATHLPGGVALGGNGDAQPLCPGQRVGTSVRSTSRCSGPPNGVMARSSSSPGAPPSMGSSSENSKLRSNASQSLSRVAVGAAAGDEKRDCEDGCDSRAARGNHEERARRLGHGSHENSDSMSWSLRHGVPPA